MKIARLVLLLSLVGAPVACTDVPVTGPQTTVEGIKPAFDTGTARDTATARDGGGSYGSGT